MTRILTTLILFLACYQSEASVFGLLASSPVYPQATPTLSITDYGAVGDAVTFQVNTVSNSPMVTVVGTNQFSSADIGKVIEVFAASSDLANSVSNQDTICLITNVTQATNLWGSLIQTKTKQTYCTVGTNNALAFQACVNAAEADQTGGVTNVIINIPSGNYLLIDSNALNPSFQNPAGSAPQTDAAVNLWNGGLTFVGQSTNTILTGCGAGMTHLWVGPSWIIPFRGYMFFNWYPATNVVTPQAFQNITFDGGVQVGYTPQYQYFPPNPNGDGWDTSHHAIAWPASVYPAQAVQSTVLTNCVFQHWRGEMIIGFGGGGTNALYDIDNCTFNDGCASGINVGWAQHIHGCLFTNLVLTQEYYAAGSSEPSLFENNITYASLSYSGALAAITNLPITVRSNLFVGGGFVIAPAQNLFITNNTFTNYVLCVNFSGFSQPNDGSQAISSNIWITGNHFYPANNGTAVYLTGQPIQNLFVSNNIGCNMVIVGGSDAPGGAGGFKTNIVFINNTASYYYFSGVGHYAYLDSRNVGSQTNLGTGNYFIDSNSGFNGQNDYDNVGITNILSYGLGGYRNITATHSGSVWYLDDSKPQYMPPGVTMMVSNSTGANVPVYESATLTGSQVTITNLTKVNFQWTTTNTWNQL